ncbi:glyoxylate/hydroxypyruvate reductase GhrA [Pantoea sp. KPR_PJ]|uniref:glyoxylate/hydroxypyruvate reductase GhrA n=1 Tax=Pantoea sp. KPR_PJ TaxID=2738375 RepID=UPI0035293F75
MEIIWYHPSQDAGVWLEGMQRRLPQARVRHWQPGDEAAADYAIVRKPPRELLAGRPGLRGVFAMGAGVDDILAQLARYPDMLSPSVPLVRLEDTGMGRQMQEYAVYCVLGWYRRFDDYRQLQQQAQWQPLELAAYEAFTVGVMGAGVLGMSVIHALKPWGFPLRVWSRSPKQIAGVTSFAGREALDAFLHGTQVVINLLPSTPETTDLFDARTLSQLPQGACLLNMARGTQVVEDDLLAALESGQLRAAALDVFQQEPLPPHHPLWRHPRVTVTPHIAALTRVDEAIEAIARAIEACEAGRQPSGCVDRLRGY